MCFREQCPTGSQAQGLDRHEREQFQQQKLERPGFDLDQIDRHMHKFRKLINEEQVIITLTYQTALFVV